MTTLTDTQIAERVARYYTSRVRHAEYDDCYQDALLALLLARRTFNEERGCWEPYAMRAATRQVRQGLYRSGSPVTGRAGHLQDNLAGHTKVELSVPLLDALSASNALNTPADEVLEQTQREVRVRDVLETVGSRMRPKSADAMQAVLLRGLTPSEAAVECGIDAETVSLAVRRVRGLLKDQYASYLAEVR